MFSSRSVRAPLKHPLLGSGLRPCNQGSAQNRAKWGIHLTQVATRCCGRAKASTKKRIPRLLLWRGVGLRSASDSRSCRPKAATAMNSRVGRLGGHSHDSGRYPIHAFVLIPVSGVAPGQGAERQQPRHEAPVGVRFAGAHQRVYLIEAGVVVNCLGRSVAEHLHRSTQAAERFKAAGRSGCQTPN